MNAFIRSRRSVQKEETRERILETARAHFERHGFDDANVRAIAKDAGVAAGTVLLHFTDKRDLLHAALFDDLEHVVNAALAVESRARIDTQLQALGRAFFAYYAERPNLRKTLLREALLADSPWRERFGAQVTRVHVHVVRLVEAARLRSEIAEDADADVLGAAFLSFYYFALIGWVQGALPDPIPLFDKMIAQHVAARPARRT